MGVSSQGKLLVSYILSIGRLTCQIILVLLVSGYHLLIVVLHKVDNFVACLAGLRKEVLLSIGMLEKSLAISLWSVVGKLLLQRVHLLVISRLDL